MNIIVEGIETEIDFDNQFVNILEIENKQFFKTLVNEIYNIVELNYESNKIILTEDESIINLSKNVMLLFDIFNVDFNNKKILSKIFSKVANNIKLEKSIDNKYDEITLEVLKYMREQLNELSFEYTIKENIEIEDILKIINFKIDLEYYNKVDEKIMFLIDLISEFNLVKILILVNVKTYFTDEELVEIYKYCNYKEVNLLLIENTVNETLLKYEKKLYIDNDFDDFLIN